MTGSRYFSEEVFHFVGHRNPRDDERNYDILKTILATGCISHPPHHAGWGETSIKIDWTKALSTEELLIPTVVCFCDIPREHLRIHIAKYGAFGLALKKELITRYGARPVMYMPVTPDDSGSGFGAKMLQNIYQVYKGFREQVYDKAGLARTRVHVLGTKPNTPAAAISTIDAVLSKEFLAFLKPFEPRLPDDHPNNFYAEREWRKFGNQVFAPRDVQCVVVARGYRRRFRADLSDYAEIKVIER
jgi:Putative abortive phage resistance protein AbiGi, antitoxin